LCGCAGGKNFSLKSEEDVEELMQTLVAQIHAKLKSELNLREIFIPNSKAEARCSVFVSHNYAACPKLRLHAARRRSVVWDPLLFRY
jgi:hypothetical protein